MRSFVLILLASAALASCEGPKAEGEKSLAPGAAPGVKKASAPDAGGAGSKTAAPSQGNPHAAAAPVGEGAPAGGNPGMGFMPDYQGGDDGMRVADVRPDGAAAKAGIVAGDVVVKFGGIPVTNVHDYMAALETVKVGDPIEIVVKRGNETKTLKGVVGVSNR